MDSGADAGAEGSSARLNRNASRSRRLTATRRTAPPTRLPTESPSRCSGEALGTAMSMNGPDALRTPDLKTCENASDPESRWRLRKVALGDDAGGVRGKLTHDTGRRAPSDYMDLRLGSDAGSKPTRTSSAETITSQGRELRRVVRRSSKDLGSGGGGGMAWGGSRSGRMFASGS